MKSIKALFVLALTLGFAVPAFAETQNVKVSGSLDAYWFYRSDFDLNGKNDVGSTPAGGGSANTTNAHASDGDSFFMSITQVQVNADLTDNVSTVVNLINQRDWNASVFDTAGGTTNANQEFDVMIDLAYVQMKEIFYAPLTLTVGRQDLVFGRGFIVGWNPQDPSASILADEFTQIQSFDAIRATLDFNPWTLDFVYAKVDEGSHDPEDDRDLWINYITYKFAEYNAVAEAYYIVDADRTTIAVANAATTGDTRMNDTHTIGGRVQFDPISQITLGAELAFQLGDYRIAATDPARDREGFGADLFGEYRFGDPWKSMLGIQYVYLSGENDLSGASTGDYGAWNGSFRLPVYGWIRDYMEGYYGTAQVGDQVAGQNQEHISIYGSINPMEDLKLTANYWHFWSPEDVFITGVPGTSTLSSDIGDEFDLAAIYAYTEDVTFTFMANWFIPGDMFVSPNDDVSSEYVTEVKVVF
ncbi:MAG TPA: alginate export family protein [Candidatus Eisenbacteria bacterium]|nr:alginate export family protein [Candidatus Eisenbacteria bacterium]